MGPHPQRCTAFPIHRSVCRVDARSRRYQPGDDRRVFDGLTEGFTRDDVLDNITHYGLTNSGMSSGRLYKENTQSFFGPKGVKIPVAVSIYPDDLYQVPRSWPRKPIPS
jgi:hypothetical protein